MTESAESGAFHWRRLYGGMTLAGAAFGLLVALGAVPAIPDQLTAWSRSVTEEVAFLALVLGGAFLGLVLTAVAHLGVRWQLSRKAKSHPDY